MQQLTFKKRLKIIFIALSVSSSSCSKLPSYKTIPAHNLINLDGVHFTAIYNVIDSPDQHTQDTNSDKLYNYYNYMGYSSGNWEFSIDAIASGFGIGSSYSCEISVKTTKKNFLKEIWLTGTNCPGIFARMMTSINSYKKNPRNENEFRTIDGDIEYGIFAAKEEDSLNKKKKGNGQLLQTKLSLEERDKIQENKIKQSKANLL